MVNKDFQKVMFLRRCVT